MKAVILAAGRGTRIERVTRGVPKCLIEFGGQTILDYQVAGLWAAGVSNIAIVIGHKGDLIVNYVRRRYQRYLRSFTFIDNPAYATTNNIYSLWLARHWVGASDFVCLNADVLCHPEILSRGLDGPASMIIDPAWRDETMKVVIRNGNIVRMSKGIPLNEYSATYIGITAFSRPVTPLLFDEIRELIAEGRSNEFFNVAVQRLVDRGLPVRPVTTRRLPWAEIDDPADLKFAKTVVFPCLPPLTGVTGPGGRTAAVA